MKRLKIFSMLSLVLVLIFVGSVFADEGVVQVEPLSPAPSAETGVMTNETPPLWFVELASTPTADGTSLSTIKAEKSAFRSNANKAGLKYTERYAFDTLFNGFSVSIKPSDLAKLSRIPGVKTLYPVDISRIPETQTIDPELATALAMTGADVAQSELGFTGAGVKVAVMDTGTDYNHPDLGGCFGVGCRVFTGYDFVGDAYDGSNTPVPDAYPDDCNGHGTHVSGIIGANGAVVGAAPGVTFGAYRVFGCEGSTTDDVMLAAMERVLADDMDVLNMSIGGGFVWPQYPIAQASDRLVNKGIVVVASIGNSGANGLYSAGAPGLGKKVIGVASFDNTRIAQAAFSISPDNKLIGFNLAAAAPPPPVSGTFSIARTGTPTTANDACSVLPAGSLAGKIALIRRGTCGFFVKATNAQTAGAIGVVLYNNVAGGLNPTVAGSPAIITIPVVAITEADGVLINSRLDSGPVDLTWGNQTVSAANPTGGLISSFSSYGLSPDLALKPDIGAPGGLIRSTYPLELGSYATISGTSMSSPHVAGAAALLLQAKPNTPSQAVRRILQNSADPKNWWGNPDLGFLDNVHRQGAGMLDIDDAILSTTNIEPAKIATGESQAGPFTQPLTLTNKGAADVTYNLSHAPALATGTDTFTPSFVNAPSTVSFSANSVVVPAGGTASVDVTITANPALANLSQYGGYIVFTPQGVGQTYRVPYAGLKGDYQSKQVLTSGGFGFPALLNGSNFGFPSAGDTFSMQGFDIPFVLVHFDHQAAKFHVELFASGSNKAWHRAYNEEYLPRNSTSTGFFAYPLDGTTFAGNKTYALPNGTYYAVITVLKANGDNSNPAHWETWTSPSFNIDRP